MREAGRKWCLPSCCSTGAAVVSTRPFQHVEQRTQFPPGHTRPAPATPPVTSPEASSQAKRASRLLACQVLRRQPADNDATNSDTVAGRSAERVPTWEPQRSPGHIDGQAYGSAAAERQQADGPSNDCFSSRWYDGGSGRRARPVRRSRTLTKARSACTPYSTTSGPRSAPSTSHRECMTTPTRLHVCRAQGQILAPAEGRLIGSAWMAADERWRVLSH
jgi:hypothetical protein